MSDSSSSLRSVDTDEQFFADHPDRKAMIRNAREGEFRGEFMSLGPHVKSRRRVLVWRPAPQALSPMIVRTPMLAFADETIENDDKVLLPILNAIMRDAAIKHRVRRGP